MLVVVYLISPKKNIIIPQEWIMSLSQETLNNIGKASYQNRRIFWTKIGIDPDGIPDSSIEPNFLRPISLEFPPSGDEACYIARVKCYCATLTRAKYFRDTFRPQLPLVYNARKQYEAPLPSLASIVQSTSHSHSFVDRQPNNIPIENAPELQVEPFASTSIDHSSSVNENSDQFREELNAQSPPAETLPNNSVPYSDDDEKCILPNVELDELDSIALSTFFDDKDEDNERENTAAPISAPNETSFLEGGILKIKTVFADDCEMVCASGAKITPYIGFDVKCNDTFSMGIPFKENVSFLKRFQNEFGSRNEIVSNILNHNYFRRMVIDHI